MKNCNPPHLPQKSVFHRQYSFCLNSCGHFNRQQTDWNQWKARKTESYRPGAPVMTCRVLRVGGGMASVRSRCLCCCSFIIAASKAGDEGDLLWTGCTRAWPGLRARLGLWPEKHYKKKINRKKFKHTSRQKKSGHLRGKYEVNLPFIGVVRWAVSPGIAEKQEYDDITSTCAEISQLIRWKLFQGIINLPWWADLSTFEPLFSELSPLSSGSPALRRSNMSLKNADKNQS